MEPVVHFRKIEAMAGVLHESPASCGPCPAPSRSRAGAVLRVLAYGVSFLLPCTNLVFLAGGPYAWDVALIWTLPVWLCIFADLRSGHAREELAAVPGWLADASLYLLFLLQLANTWLLLRTASQLAWGSAADFATAAANVAAMRIMTGTNACCSGIAVAHELIHRRASHVRHMGRILLWTVCYDHFLVEHLLGHHRRAGTAEDPATARFGETHRQFRRRSLRRQFVSAWQLESRRLALTDCAAPWRHRVLQGILAQGTLLVCIGFWFGPAALLMFLYQALVAVNLLETVNYFQHWGLTRTGRRFAATDAWSTDSWFTVHAFIGLARHADHHAHGSRPFQDLRSLEESPTLPGGYFVMAIAAKLFNRRYRLLAEQEMRRRHLGPFRRATPRDTRQPTTACLNRPSSSICAP